MEYQQKSFFVKSPAGKSLAASAVWPKSGEIAGILLIVPPLVEERKALLPPLTEFSRKIAAENSIASLRIDLSGTGDSAGELAAASVGEWLEEIVAAAGLLLAAGGMAQDNSESRALHSAATATSSVKIALLGVRTGAMLALSAASRIDGVTSVLLWDPVTGDESVKQWLQRRMVNDMMAYGKAKVSRQALIAELEKGNTVDLDGFPVSGALYAELKKLTYDATCNVQFSSGTAVATTRDPPSAERKSGDNVQFPQKAHVLVSGRPLPSLQKWTEDAPGVSIEEIKLPPYWNSVGYIDTLSLQEASAKWLAVQFGDENFHFDFAKIPSVETMEERLVEISSCGKTVRGVYTVPTCCSGTENQARAVARAVLFLGGWSGDRQGPHRIFTEYARRLAARGVASLRIDYLGRGESDLSHSETGIQIMARNGTDAAEWLCAEAGLPTLDIVAICSGCKVAITVSTISARVGNLNLWSAEAMGSLRSGSTNSKKTASAFKVYLQKLFRLETWKKILTGRVNTSMVGKALAGHETRSAAEAENEDKTLKVFRNFKGHITFVYGGSDPDAGLASDAYRGFCGKHGMKAEFHVVPNAGHSYYALDWTEKLLLITDNAMKGDHDGQHER